MKKIELEIEQIKKLLQMAYTDGQLSVVGDGEYEVFEAEDVEQFEDWWKDNLQSVKRKLMEYIVNE